MLLKGLWQTPKGFLRTWGVGSAGPRGPCLSFRLQLWGRRSSLWLSWTSPFSPNSFSYGVVFSQNLNSPSVLKTWQGCAPIGSRIVWIFCPCPAHRAQHDGSGPAPTSTTTPPSLYILAHPPPCSSAGRAHPSPPLPLPGWSLL